ncbi:MAG: phosphoglycerate dehydrogenase [Bacillota bacterium]|nr:phosphoglycerate dehydrogenase [Bacillota bacterium]
MFNIKLYNKIAACGLQCFDAAHYTCAEEIDNYDGILVRSAALHEVEFPKTLKAIARAGAGVNNIPIDKCSEAGIVVFNTPGANANAVKELVIAGLLLSSRKINDGIAWAKTLTGDDVAKQVEKGKSAFVGPEIEGKTLGIIGLGAIGVMVANAAEALGMNVLGYDPYISVDAAWGLSRSVQRAKDLSAIIKNSDYITIHVPLNPETRGMINADIMNSMKKGVRILNFARGELVNDDDMEAALASGQVACYITDFPNGKTVKMPGVIPVPHLGASTPESEDNCAVYACRELVDYLENGNIKNSVNFPDMELPRTTHKRICVIHKNMPNMISPLTAVLSGKGINIENMYNKSKKDNAYTVLEIDGDIPAGVDSEILAIPEVKRVRII